MPASHHSLSLTPLRVLACLDVYKRQERYLGHDFGDLLQHDQVDARCIERFLDCLPCRREIRDVYKRQVRGTFAPEARCGYRNPTLSSILATQMPCRSRRSGA